MCVKPCDFLNSAIQLAGSGDEMSKRNALSRAYYAAYHHAIEICDPVGEDEEARTGMHRRFIEGLVQSDPGTLNRRVGVKLNTLYAKRIKADYRLTDEIVASQVALQINDARAVLALP